MSGRGGRSPFVQRSPDCGVASIRYSQILFLAIQRTTTHSAILSLTKHMKKSVLSLITALIGIAFIASCAPQHGTTATSTQRQPPNLHRRRRPTRREPRPRRRRPLRPRHRLLLQKELLHLRRHRRRDVRKRSSHGESVFSRITKVEGRKRSSGNLRSIDRPGQLNSRGALTHWRRWS